MHNPEYLSQNSYLFVDENNIKAFGLITDLFYDTVEKFNCPALGNKEQRLKTKKSKLNKERMGDINNKTGMKGVSGVSESEGKRRNCNSFKNK